MAIQDPTGKFVPELRFRVLRDGALEHVTSKELFAGKTVALVALPGAFTPTCSSSHVPRYVELLPNLKEQGIDDVVVVSVNDAFVMDAWQKDQQAFDVTFLADGNGELTEALGMLVDKSDLGFGKRSWRYSAIVENGKIARAFVEPEKPGDPFEVSDADTMLAALAPDARPVDVVLFTRPGCSHCTRAKSALEEAGLGYEAVDSTRRALRAVSGSESTPQVFIDNEHIGGADELGKWLSER